MVAGDLVNTAARLQGVAPPGTVLVGESDDARRRAAIVFEPVGDQSLKGKSTPVPAWHALRVVAQRGGAGTRRRARGAVRRPRRGAAPAQGAAPRGRSRPACAARVDHGSAGIGKSRLAWELEKYIDGVAEDIYWHRGRSPVLRRGRHLLGARRDGPPPRAADRGRRRGDDARARSPRPSTSTSPIRTSASWIEPRAAGPAGRRGGPGRRARRTVRGVATLLRAHRRAGHDGARLRGPPVGRLRPARLHRPPARLVARPADPGRHAGAAGALRPAAGLGRRPPRT